MEKNNHLNRLKEKHQMDKSLTIFIDAWLPRIEKKLADIIQVLQMPARLKEAMHYSVDAGGKRIRPLLVLATMKDLQFEPTEDALAVACAVEFIHTYSLIHDDLPCMDDDDYRRGKLTNHKVYGEATAVLAGDALQSLAFLQIANLTQTSPEQVIKLIQLLASSSGATGMVGGQILDLAGETKLLSLPELEEVHLHKTGALLAFCIEAGATLAQASQETYRSLQTFAKNIGLAFQIKDDILDITSTTEQLGKPANSDTESEKSTYPSLLGLDGAKAQLAARYETALQALTFQQEDASLLKSFAKYIVERKA